jgi:peroxiredoxin
MKRAILLFGIVILASAVPHIRGQNGADAKQPLVRLQGIDKKYYDVADMRGNVVLVSFGATWCAPCSGELYALEELKHEYQNKAVEFLWVTVETDGQISDSGLKRYAAEHKLSFPVLRDPTKTAYLQFSPRLRLPMIVLFDKDGNVDGPAQFGMSSDVNNYKKRMRARLDALLSSASSQ